MAPRLVVQFLLSTAVSASSLLSRLLVAGPRATGLLGLVLALSTPLPLGSASLQAAVLSLLSVALPLLNVLLVLATVGLPFVALLPGRAGRLSASGLMLLRTAPPARLLVPRRECLVTGRLSASSLIPSLPTAGTPLLSRLSPELLLVLPVTRLWALPSRLGALLTDLWTLPAAGLGRRRALVSLRPSTTGGLMLLSPSRRTRLPVSALRSSILPGAFGLPLWGLLALRRPLSPGRLLARRRLLAPRVRLAPRGLATAILRSTDLGRGLLAPGLVTLGLLFALLTVLMLPS